MSVKDRQEDGVLTPGEPPTPEPNETIDKSDIERLGRQRPTILGTWFAEFFFVFTIVTSMMMSEYFVRAPLPLFCNNY